jgi:hypothetical protein
MGGMATFVGGGALTLTIALGFYLLHTRVTEEEEWYADFLLALGLCVMLYGAVAVAVSQAAAEQPVEAKGAVVNPMVDDDSSNSPERDSDDSGVAEEPTAQAQADSTGTPGPFVLAIGLFFGAFVAAMIGVATNEWQEGLVSQAADVYEDFDTFESFATAVLPGDPGSFRLLMTDDGVTANQTISVPNLVRLKIEGVVEASVDAVQNTAPLELAPLYGGEGQAFRVLSGGSLELQYLTIANRTEGTACGGVPCCSDADASPCPVDQQMGGAAAYVAPGGQLTAMRVMFRDLHVAGDGGAIVSYGVIRVRQSWFLDCTANRWGGALAPMEGAGSLAGVVNVVEDSTFARCSSETGGAIDVGVPNFRLRRSHFVDNRIECSAPPYAADVCHGGENGWYGEGNSDTHPRGDQLSTAVFWFGHNVYGEPAGCGEACGALCGGPQNADRSAPGYSGTCWENDLIMSIPAAAVPVEVRLNAHPTASSTSLRL